MIFRIIAVFALLALIFRLTFARFAAAAARGRKKPASLRPGAYFAWIRERSLALFKLGTPPAARRAVRNWLRRRYPGWRMWIWVALAASFGYNALSGFAWAIFSRRGLWGAPLLVHVMSGGLFAASLAAAVVLGAKRYGFEKAGGKERVECIVCPVFKSIPVPLARSLAFWSFVFSGLVLAATALASMLPYFVYTAQLAFIDIHRYGALAALVAALAFADLDLIPRRA